VSIVDKKLAFIFLFCSTLSCAFQKKIPLSFDAAISGIRTIPGVNSVNGSYDSRFKVDKCCVLIDLNLKEYESSIGNSLGFKKATKSFDAIVKMAAAIFDGINQDKGAVAIITEGIDPNANQLSEISKKAKTIDDYRVLLNNIKKHKSKENVFVDMVIDKFILCKRFAKKVIFFNSIVPEHDDNYKKVYKNKVPFKGSDEYPRPFLYEDFDCGNFLKHMRELRKPGPYCFVMIVSENNHFGSVIVNKNSLGKIECLCIGISDRNNELIQDLINFQDKNLLENAIVRFLLVQYSSEIAQEKIKKLNLDDNSVLQDFRNIKPPIEQCYSCSGYKQRIEEFIKSNNALYKSNNALHEETKKIRIVNWLNNLLANICTNACIAISVFGLTYWLMLLK